MPLDTFKACIYMTWSGCQHWFWLCWLILDWDKYGWHWQIHYVTTTILLLIKLNSSYKAQSNLPQWGTSIEVLVCRGWDIAKKTWSTLPDWKSSKVSLRIEQTNGGEQDFFLTSFNSLTLSPFSLSSLTFLSPLSPKSPQGRLRW
jgi:hypothetical protein